MLSNWTQKIVELAQSIIGLSNIPDSQKMLKWAFIISNKKDKLVHLSLWLLTSVFMYTSILYRYWKAPIYAYQDTIEGVIFWKVLSRSGITSHSTSLFMPTSMKCTSGKNFANLLYNFWITENDSDFYCGYIQGYV